MWREIVFYYINEQYCTTDGTRLQRGRSMAYYNIKSGSTMHLDQIQDSNEVMAKKVAADAVKKWKSQQGVRRHVEGSYGDSGQPVLILANAEGRKGLNANRFGMGNNSNSRILPLPSLLSLPSTNSSTALPAQHSTWCLSSSSSSSLSSSSSPSFFLSLSSKFYPLSSAVYILK